MLPKSVAQNDGIMSSAVSNDVHMIFCKGNDKQIVVYPVDYDQQFNVTCTYPSDLSSQQTSNNNSAAVVGTVTRVLELFLMSLILMCFLCSLQPKNLSRRRS